MTDRQGPHERKIVCIAGMLAAGKTTLIRGLTDKLDGAAVLVFDEYERFCEWPEDLAKWIAEGADPAQVHNPRLQQDLEALLDRHPIQHPIDEHIISPSPIILLEDPFGRTRPDIQALIDLVLFVDLPVDLSVVRMTQRALGLDDVTLDAMAELPKDDLLKRIHSARQWLIDYRHRRTMYTTLVDPVRATADEILDGTKPVQEVLEDALATINPST